MLGFFAGRSTLNRLTSTAERNILRAHRRQTRPQSTKSETASSPSSSSSAPPPSYQPGSGPRPAWAWIDPLLTPLRAYGRMQQRSPLTTQLESSLVIYYLGDLSAQMVQTNVFSEGSYEPVRGLRAMLIGGIIAIPSFKWFVWLGRHFNYSSHLLSLGVKIVVGQCLFTPAINCYFFGMQTILTGGGWKDVKERIINTVPTSWVNSWKFWPVITAFSFTFIPWQHRNVFAGFVSIFWQTYLFWLNRREERREEMEKQLAVTGGQQQEIETDFDQPMSLSQLRRNRESKEVLEL